MQDLFWIMLSAAIVNNFTLVMFLGLCSFVGVTRKSSTALRLGIANTSQVVVYDQAVGHYATRLWWSLRYLGHDAVALLDGGWAKWISEGRPVKSGDETRAATGFMPSPSIGRASEVGGAPMATRRPTSLVLRLTA